MTRAIEIELKFEVQDPHQLARFVKGLPTTGQKHIVDVYLDTEAANLFQRGIFMRIRNDHQFDIKFNQEDLGKGLGDAIEHSHCDEVSVPLPFTPSAMTTINDTLATLGIQPMTEPSLADLKHHNHLIESIIIDKHRTSYAADDFHLDVDSVANLGEYLEIEQMADEHTDPAQVIGRMQAYLQDLKLTHVDVGYNELYWRQHNFDRYLQGKYLLLEDRQKYRPHTLKK